jgi:Na+/phosphate symporter
MGEIVDAIKAVAELGKDSVKESIEQRLKKLEDNIKKLEDKKSDEALKLQREEVRLSAAKFLFVVIGATLVMLLAGDHVVGLLRPKAPTLAQRMETFSERDRKYATTYLSKCIKELESLGKSLAPTAGVPGQTSPPSQEKQENSGDKQQSRQQVTRLRSACSEIVGE